MVYESQPHDDSVTPDNIVRSQFGTPRASTNGAGSGRVARDEVPEPYRFDPARPRQRRHAAEDTQDEGKRATAPIPRSEYGDDPAKTGEIEKQPAPSWMTDRQQATSGEIKRASRAERRRAAEQATDTTARSSDLDRIAQFLRSTQEVDEAPADPTRQHDDLDQGEADKTSELPTVKPTHAATAPLPAATTPPPSQVTTPPPSQEVIATIRQIPGVADARLNESDNKLALEIADDADADSVHRQVVQVLDNRLGLQAQPVSPAAESVESEVTERPVAIPPGSRVILERVQMVTSGFESSIEVGLTVNGARAVGRANGPAVDWHILRGAADATVDAVGVLLGKHARVVVEHASVDPAGSCRVATVLVLLMTETGTEHLAGAAVVDGDRRQAVVHATLQALNRRLEAMLPN